MGIQDIHEALQPKWIGRRIIVQQGHVEGVALEGHALGAVELGRFVVAVGDVTTGVDLAQHSTHIAIPFLAQLALAVLDITS